MTTSHKPLKMLHLLPPAPVFITGGRDAVPGLPTLLPGLPLLPTNTTHTSCNLAYNNFSEKE